MLWWWFAPACRYMRSQCACASVLAIRSSAPACRDMSSQCAFASVLAIRSSAPACRCMSLHANRSRNQVCPWNPLLPTRPLRRPNSTAIIMAAAMPTITFAFVVTVFCRTCHRTCCRRICCRTCHRTCCCYCSHFAFVAFVASCALAATSTRWRSRGNTLSRARARLHSPSLFLDGTVVCVRPCTLHIQPSARPRLSAMTSSDSGWYGMNGSLCRWHWTWPKEKIMTTTTLQRCFMAPSGALLSRSCATRHSSLVTVHMPFVADRGLGAGVCPHCQTRCNVATPPASWITRMVTRDGVAQLFFSSGL